MTSRTARTGLRVLGAICVVASPTTVSAQSEAAASVSGGAEIRARYEYVRNSDFGRDRYDPNGYLMRRIMLHGEMRASRHVRVFVQLKSSLLDGRAGGARPTDVDKADLHQVFTDFIAPLADDRAVRLRVGRQELALGASRFIAVREGPNVRRSFDGLRVSVPLGGWRTDAFVLAPVETDPGLFDDAREKGRRLWGVYATSVLFPTRLSLDAYYLGVMHPQATYEQGSGRELRHTFGIRTWGRSERVDYEVEAAYQTGSFGRGGIRAWTVASNAGYMAPSWPGRPRFGMMLDATSGDSDPTNANLGTFNPLFPGGTYFGHPSLIGPLNHFGVHPTADVQLSDQLTLTGDWGFCWRQSTDDGLYRASGAYQVTGRGNSERMIGSQASATIRWKVDPRTTVHASYSRFTPGVFLRGAGLGRNVDFAMLSFTYHIWHRGWNT